MAAHGTGDVVVESTWQVEDVDDLPQKILWRDSVCELTQETDAANCFALNRPAPPHANAACTLKLILRNGRQVSVLQVLSEASTLELYGKHGEYIGTSKGDLLDDVDGALLFENRIDLRSCQSEILIKFHRKTSVENLWVFGMCVVTKKTEERPKFPVAAAMNRSGMMSLGSLDGRPKDGLELVIDLKMKEMEQRLMRHIDERFNRLELRLEQGNSHLIELLTKNESR